MPPPPHTRVMAAGGAGRLLYLTNRCRTAESDTHSDDNSWFSEKSEVFEASIHVRDAHGPVAATPVDDPPVRAEPVPVGRGAADVERDHRALLRDHGAVYADAV